MSNISISDLNSTGNELFIDSESFMNELTNNELDIFGGEKFPESIPVLTIRESAFCKIKTIPIDPKIEP